MFVYIDICMSTQCLKAKEKSQVKEQKSEVLTIPESCLGFIL